MFSYQESKDSKLIAQMNYLSEINRTRKASNNFLFPIVWYSQTIIGQSSVFSRHVECNRNKGSLATPLHYLQYMNTGCIYSVLAPLSASVFDTLSTNSHRYTAHCALPLVGLAKWKADASIIDSYGEFYELRGNIDRKIGSSCRK